MNVQRRDVPGTYAGRPRPDALLEIFSVGETCQIMRTGPRRMDHTFSESGIILTSAAGVAFFGGGDGLRVSSCPRP